MLGLIPGPDRVLAGELAQGLARAPADFERCRYRRLAVRLPRLISAGHLLATDAGTARASTLLAGIYTLTTRMLIKFDDQQLGWMAADRAKILAAGGGDPLLEAETARNLAVLARKAGWHDQAASIALAAAASPGLRGPDPRLAAERGLLIQSAAYTAARAHDRDGMRELTSQAMALGGEIGEGGMLRDHGGFGPATVALHLISAETSPATPAPPSPQRSGCRPRACRQPSGAPGTGLTPPGRTPSGVAGTRPLMRCSPASTRPLRTSTPARQSTT